MLNPDRIASVRGSHHISPFNFWPETLADTQFPRRIHLIDSTLRKTYFTAGNVMSLDGYVRIAEALVELGVETTCLNVTFGSGADPVREDWELMQTVLDAKLPITINVWSDGFLTNGRDRRAIDSIDALHRFVDAGATTIAPGLVAAPTAEAEARQMDELARFMDEVRRLGITATITIAGIGMRDVEQMARTCHQAAELGVTRLDFMDSSSSLSPEGTRAFAQRMRAAVGDAVPITMHMHDEFGLATACAIAAASAGAHLDVSLNGMSYRCGFAPLEEVALSLEVFYGVDTGLNLERLDHASKVVARESQVPIPELKPLTGRYAHLKHMAGDAAAAIRTGQDAFPPISHGLVPARMGSRVEWVWPSVSSNDLTRALAESCDLDLTDAELEAVRTRLDEVVNAIDRFPRWLEPAHAEALLRRTVANLRGEWLVPTTTEVIKAVVPGASLVPVLLERAIVEGLGEHDDAQPDRLRPVVAVTVASMTNGQLIDLLAGFDKFDGDGRGAQPDHSRIEETDVHESTLEARTRLVAAARRYEAHFGFPPVVRAEGKSADVIADTLEAATDATPASELARIRTEVAAILDARLVRATTPKKE